MGPGPRLQTEVTYVYDSSCPVCIVIGSGNTDLRFHITEGDATNLANEAKSFNSNPYVKFSSEQSWDFDVYWFASDRFEIICYNTHIGTSIKFNMNAKQAYRLWAQISVAIDSSGIVTPTVKTKCSDCHGTGRIAMLNFDVDCDCVKK